MMKAKKNILVVAAHPDAEIASVKAAGAAGG